MKTFGVAWNGVVNENRVVCARVNSSVLWGYSERRDSWQEKERGVFKTHSAWHSS